jgi:hypothetical protein
MNQQSGQTFISVGGDPVRERVRSVSVVQSGPRYLTTRASLCDFEKGRTLFPDIGFAMMLAGILQFSLLCGGQFD